MLNVTVGGTDRAAGYGRYLSGQVIANWTPEIKALARGADVAEGRTAYEDALAAMIETERIEVRTDLLMNLEGLRLALDAVGETSYVAAVDRLIGSIDSLDFDEYIDGLELAFDAAGQHTYAASLQISRDLHEAFVDERTLIDRASDRLAHAVWQAREGRSSPEPSGIQYRQDTDPRLAKLLHFNPNIQPTPKAVTNLMRAKDAQGHTVHRVQSNGFIDFTFSAGKDASIAWAFGSATEKAVIFAAHTKAVDAAMRQIERDIGQVRRGYRDRVSPQPGHITWIQFHHETARPTGHPGDPLLHTHVVVPNIVLSKTTNDVGCLDSYKSHGQFVVYRRTYFQEFSTRLQSLGIDVAYDERGPSVRIPAVPAEVAKEFSKRTAQATDAAERFLANRGIDFNKLSPDEQKYTRNLAAQATRRSRDTGVADRQSWRRQAEAMNWKWTNSMSRAMQVTFDRAYNRGGAEIEWDDLTSPKLSL